MKKKSFSNYTKNILTSIKPVNVDRCLDLKHSTHYTNSSSSKHQAKTIQAFKHEEMLMGSIWMVNGINDQMLLSMNPRSTKKEG